MEHCCHLKPFCHLHPVTSPCRVWPLHAPPPTPHAPAGVEGPPLHTARHHPWPRQRRAPRVPWAQCPPPPSAWLPPLYLFSITLHDPKPDSLKPYGTATRSHSITTHIHTLIFFSYRTRTRTRSRTLRAAVCAPAAPAAAPRQFLGSCLHVARWQYAWYVWEDYITAQRDQS